MIRPFDEELFLDEYRKGPNRSFKKIRKGELVMSLRFRYSIKINKTGRWGVVGWGEEFQTSKGYTLEKLIDTFQKVVFRPNQSQNVYIDKDTFFYGYIDNIDSTEKDGSREPFVKGICRNGFKIKFYDDEALYLLSWDDVYNCVKAYIPKKVEYKIATK